ncbi:uncharacterized protein CLUP02_12531 [Colletotrichum lupini]|uniref:Uncharacterized protein n=1 Tax=Colletotrichum lupini TaxID=145971 RepID=A0A9Q8T0J4_9PEZI|nr:uncharacterized protein CLUP02_12531 [Colletotrichum lupini]UQC87029.1 hypothetical protein CLUP02_12531 [Colletotrichum lupini]
MGSPYFTAQGRHELVWHNNIAIKFFLHYIVTASKCSAVSSGTDATDGKGVQSSSISFLQTVATATQSTDFRAKERSLYEVQLKMFSAPATQHTPMTPPDWERQINPLSNDPRSCFQMAATPEMRTDSANIPSETGYNWNKVRSRPCLFIKSQHQKMFSGQSLGRTIALGYRFPETLDPNSPQLSAFSVEDIKTPKQNQPSYTGSIIHLPQCNLASERPPPQSTNRVDIFASSDIRIISIMMVRDLSQGCLRAVSQLQSTTRKLGEHPLAASYIVKAACFGQSPLFSPAHRYAHFGLPSLCNGTRSLCGTRAIHNSENATISYDVATDGSLATQK